MKAILSADSNWGIGYQNKLLIHISADMKFFRQTTTGHVVIMGRKTLESFPGGKPLENRVNIVLTSNKNYKAQGCTVVHSVEELLEVCKQYDEEDLFVIGGGTVYKLLLPYCSKVYVTKINYAYQADTYFPNLDQDTEWEMTEEGEEQTCFDIEFAFCTYERKRSES